MEIAHTSSIYRIQVFTALREVAVLSRCYPFSTETHVMSCLYTKGDYLVKPHGLIYKLSLPTNRQEFGMKGKHSLILKVMLEKVELVLCNKSL